jgi:hypothetical protein
MKIKNFLRTQLLWKKTCPNKKKKKNTFDLILCYIHLSMVYVQILDYIFMLWCICWVQILIIAREIFVIFFKVFLWIEFQKFCYDFFVINVFWCLKSLLTWFHFIICTHKLKLKKITKIYSIISFSVSPWCASTFLQNPKFSPKNCDAQFCQLYHIFLFFTQMSLVTNFPKSQYKLPIHKLLPNVFTLNLKIECTHTEPQQKDTLFSTFTKGP